MAFNDALDIAPPISVRFWGVRGSVACPGPRTARYGGNTPCVEIRCGEHLFILDAGTGIRPLGNMLAQSALTQNFDILLSHCHLDHIVGLPFFMPLFARDRTVRIWAGNLQSPCSLESTVRKIMSSPLFPLQIEAWQANVQFRDFKAGKALDLRPGVKVRTAPLLHPGGATGYRIEHSGCSVAYVTDVEIGTGPVDQTLLLLAKDVDLLILDTTYTNDELPSHVGWGHSSWQQGIKLANEAGVGRLCLFHHDPEHDDRFMDEIAKAAAAARPGTFVASEGLHLELSAAPAGFVPAVAVAASS
jgi:phosphoribosyl 1,2-cyclic phosphodiesterase